MFLGLSTEKWLTILTPIILAIIAGVFGAKFIRNRKIHKIGNITGDKNQVINGDVNSSNNKEENNV